MKQQNSTNNSFCVGFIGLGLIGGSIAKSIRRVYPNTEILGFDVDQVALNTALQEGTLNKSVTSIEAMNHCDYIFLCAPVHYNIAYLPILKSIIKESCILTDVGSVKNDIYDAIHQNHLDEYFIGGHPMVGSERSGYDAASDRLIENAYYFITPSSSVKQEKVEEYRTFLEDLGAIPIIYSPSEHDEITAYISHIPHVIASALVNLVASKEDENGMLRQLAAGGFKDITRIASSNPVVWEHILLSNPHHIATGLRTFIQELEDMTAAIEKNEARQIYSFFDTAKDYRNSIPEHATGVIRMNYEVYVDIPDEPGAVAKVTNILAEHQINLKNMGITHNREDNEGVLRLCFYTNEDAVTATERLMEQQYRIYER
ncbi:MAG: prephenate dehydrogenase [Eubacteriales bacterium]|nr:prephenate dehydrogenase [Eubacteriales bacterium]